MDIEGVVFDFDGLLADTASAWRAAEETVAAASGRAWTADDHRSLHGLGIDSAADALAHRLGREPRDSESTREELLDAYSRRVDQVTPLPGAVEIVKALVVVYPLAVASNSPLRLVQQQLYQFGLLHHFRAVVCADSTLRSKPAPDLYQHAATRLSCHPRDTVGLDDSQAGVDSARDAGCMTIGIGPGLAGCSHRVDSLNEALDVINRLGGPRDATHLAGG